MARSMMRSMNMLAKFWGEALTTAVYILNCAPTKSVVGITPYEAWHKQKPSVHHMHTFGCIAHVKKVSNHDGKFAARSTLMVFIGYESGSKAYRVYDPATGKVCITRDVVFEEEKVWDWNTIHSSEGTSIGEVFEIHYKSNELAETFDETQQMSSTPRQAATQGVDIEAEEEATHTPLAMPETVSTQVSAEITNSSWEAPARMRTLQELYDAIEPVEIDYSEMCLLGIEEPANFRDANKEES